MVMPSQPWPKPVSPREDLLKAVASGDVGKVREFFDNAFWANVKVKPEWAHLKMALLKRDQPMVQLLVTWGAAVTPEELESLRPSGMHGESARLLRRCGLDIHIVPGEEAVCDPAVDFITKRFVDDEYADHRITEIPEEWRRVLRSFKEQGAKEAIIAGGALRDLFNKRAVKDVDIFLASRGSQKKNKKFLKDVFESAGLDIVKQADSSSVYSALVDIPAPKEGNLPCFTSISVTENFIESWMVRAGDDKTEYNIVFVSGTLGKQREPWFIHCILDVFDFGLCQIACDGGRIVTTRLYDEDAKNKGITLNKNSAAGEEHLRRIITKYPD